MAYTETKWTNQDGSVVTIYRGENTTIDDGATIGNGAKIGNRATIGNWTTIGYGATIGNWTTIGDEATIGNGAKIGDGDETEFPIYIAPMPGGPKNYYITITSKTIAIGCQMHSLADWASFDDRSILEMDGKPALEFWRKYKAVLFAMAEVEGWWVVNKEAVA